MRVFRAQTVHIRRDNGEDKGRMITGAHVLFRYQGGTLGGKKCSAENINAKAGKSRADVNVRGKHSAVFKGCCEDSSSDKYGSDVRGEVASVEDVLGSHLRGKFHTGTRMWFTFVVGARAQPSVVVARV